MAAGDVNNRLGAVVSKVMLSVVPRAIMLSRESLIHKYTVFTPSLELKVNDVGRVLTQLPPLHVLGVGAVDCVSLKHQPAAAGSDVMLTDTVLVFAKRGRLGTIVFVGSLRANTGALIATEIGEEQRVALVLPAAS